jgi:hypothetical protein
MIEIQRMTLQVAEAVNSRSIHATEILAKTDAHSPVMMTPYRHCRILTLLSGVT